MKKLLLLIIAVSAGIFWHLNQLPAETNKAISIIEAPNLEAAKQAAGISFLKREVTDAEYWYFKMDSTADWEKAAEYLCKKKKLTLFNKYMLMGFKDLYGEDSEDYKTQKNLYENGRIQSFSIKKPLKKIIHFIHFKNQVKIHIS